MKKLLIATLLAAMLVLALASTALADFGPHGGFTASTDKCASCHRIHSAKDPGGMLLIAPVSQICESCHDGNGAYTDVVDGMYGVTSNGAGGVVDPGTFVDAQWAGHGAQGYGLFGGGLGNAAMAHTFNGKLGYDAASVKPLPSATTSTHNYTGGVGTPWGAGQIGDPTTYTAGPPASGPAPLALECTSCHDPHGNAGKVGNVPSGAPMPSYRLLRFTPTGSGGFQAVGVAGNAASLTTLGYWSAANGNPNSTAGITVTDTAATNKWYTPNTDGAVDPTVGFYRARFDTTTGTWGAWSGYITARGDYAGRNYVYQSPTIPGYTAISTTGTYAGLVTTMYTCTNGTGALPPVPTTNQAPAAYVSGVDYYPCGAPTLAPFNNSTVNANGTGGAAGRAKLPYWCSTCHDRYLSGNRSADSGDPYYMYRHQSVSVPCVDCHVAHGTTATMTNTNLNYPTAALTTGSILLKTDERSVCLKCHGTSVNFSYVP